MAKLTSEWFRAALIRAIKTIAQTAVGMITVGAAISEISWGYVASVALVAGVISILTSIAGIPETTVDEELYVDEEGNISNVNANALVNKGVMRVKFKK